MERRYLSMLFNHHFICFVFYYFTSLEVSIILPMRHGKKKRVNGNILSDCIIMTAILKELIWDRSCSWKLRSRNAVL